MNRLHSFGALVLCGGAALALAGCEPSSTVNMGDLDMVTPAQQDQICLDAVKAKTGATQAAVISSDHQGGQMEIVGGKTYDSVVTVNVEPSNDQYHCLIDDSGTVGDIHGVSSTHTPS